MAPESLTPHQKEVRRRAFCRWMDEIDLQKGVKRHTIADEVGLSRSTLNRPYANKGLNAPKWQNLKQIEERYGIPAPDELRPGYFSVSNNQREASSTGAGKMSNEDLPNEDAEILYDLWMEHGTAPLFRLIRAFRARHRRGTKRGA